MPTVSPNSTNKVSMSKEEAKVGQKIVGKFSRELPTDRLKP